MVHVQVIGFERQARKYRRDCQRLAIGQVYERRGHFARELNPQWLTEGLHGAVEVDKDSYSSMDVKVAGPISDALSASRTRTRLPRLLGSNSTEFPGFPTAGFHNIVTIIATTCMSEIRLEDYSIHYEPRSS